MVKKYIHQAIIREKTISFNPVKDPADIFDRLSYTLDLVVREYNSTRSELESENISEDQEATEQSVQIGSPGYYEGLTIPWYNHTYFSEPSNNKGKLWNRKSNRLLASLSEIHTLSRCFEFRWVLMRRRTYRTLLTEEPEVERREVNSKSNH